MNRTGKRLSVCALLAGSVLLAAAAGPKWKLPPETAKLKPGTGAELALGNCLLCHSADYILTQPPLDRAAWQAIVVKMREKFGAPLPPEKVEAVVEYLAQTYGKKAGTK